MYARDLTTQVTSSDDNLQPHWSRRLLLDHHFSSLLHDIVGFVDLAPPNLNKKDHRMIPPHHPKVFLLALLTALYVERGIRKVVGSVWQGNTLVLTSRKTRITDDFDFADSVLLSNDIR